MLLVILLLFPAVIGLLVSYMMDRDQQEEKRKEKLKTNSSSMTRFFKIRKAIIIICPAHRSSLQKNQVALVDATRCKFCVDRPGNP